MKAYRDNGAVGALLDEYEKAISALKSVIKSISNDELIFIADTYTKDPNCHSIQTILTHVESACYGYIIRTRAFLGENIAPAPKILRGSSNEYMKALDKAFQFNVDFFDDYPDIEIEVFEDSKKILFSWGQKYDVEQLMEHAIVHILRHRRQIERFLLTIRSNKNS